jgi:hypothetical protein
MEERVETKPHLCECETCGSTEFCIEEIHGIKFVVCRCCDKTYCEVA